MGYVGVPEESVRVLSLKGGSMRCQPPASASYEHRQ